MECSQFAEDILHFASLRQMSTETQKVFKRHLAGAQTHCRLVLNIKKDTEIIFMQNTLAVEFHSRK